jgi:hypothetical protein
MPKTHSFRQPRRCANGAAFHLQDLRAGSREIGSIDQAMTRKISETLATYGSRRTRRMLEKAMREPRDKRRGRGRT